MQNDSRESRADQPALMLAWGMPGSDVHESIMDFASAWLPAGVVLLAWTGITLLLTS